MKCLVVCLLGLWASSAVGQAPELARCKRIMCDMLCPFGKQLDNNGCEVCDCKPNPCADMNCPAKQACVPVPEPHCQQCPMFKCKEADCPFGRSKDRFGCQICDCKVHPCEGFKCSKGERCMPMKDCDADQKCDMTPQCVPDDQHEEPPISCAMPQCANSCEFGYKNDANGCMTCTCRDGPCDTHRCPEGSECQMKQVPCHRGDCPAVPSCEVTGLCKKTQTNHTMECDNRGTFKPTQCHSPEGALHKECWCVNDRGMETQGSRMEVKDEKTPDCAYNRTVRIHVRFFMRHDLDVVAIHLGRIRTEVHRHITQWLMIDREYIVSLKVEPDTHQAKLLVVEFEVVRKGEIDLAATAVHLQDHWNRGRCGVRYQGQDLKPEGSLHMEHQYGPEVLEVYKRRCGGGLVFILGCVGATVLLVGVIIMIVMVNKKRVQKKRRQRFTEKGDSFKSNIAFSNELYDQTNMLEGDIKKIKLEFTNEPIVEASINPSEA